MVVKLRAAPPNYPQHVLVYKKSLDLLHAIDQFCDDPGPKCDPAATLYFENYMRHVSFIVQMLANALEADLLL